MTRGMQQLSKGDTSIAIETHQSHEIGSMVAAIKIFRDTAVERVRLEQLAEEKHQKEQSATANYQDPSHGF